LLLVDDSPAFRTFLRDLLSDVARQVFECGSGEGALAAYREHAPDWVLMDIAMPGKLDGLAATTAIIREFPSACVLIVTQHDGKAMEQAASKAGARGFLGKDNCLLLRDWLCDGTKGGSEGRAPGLFKVKQ
jgi:DNA-binding NarL/FixJ family response regulator